MKEGGGGREVFLPFFPTPPRSFTPFTRAIFALSLTLVPRSLLRNLKEGSTLYQTLRNGHSGNHGHLLRPLLGLISMA